MGYNRRLEYILLAATWRETQNLSSSLPPRAERATISGTKAACTRSSSVSVNVLYPLNPAPADDISVIDFDATRWTASVDTSVFLDGGVLIQAKKQKTQNVCPRNMSRARALPALRILYSRNHDYDLQFTTCSLSVPVGLLPISTPPHRPIFLHG